MQQDTMDSIIVLLRIRPFNEKEFQEEAQPCFKIDEHSKNTVILDGSSKGEVRYFTFDHVCPEQISQEEIFRIVGIPTARSCLQGYNGCIFAYGQTGAGKTYTIQGQGLDINVTESLQPEIKEKIGLLPRVVEYMFSDIASAHDTSSSIAYSVKCSYLEIYNDHIIDLLNPSAKNLQVREDLKRGVHVEGLSEENCANGPETIDLLIKGNRNRHIGSTNLNIESSRSHSVFTFTVESKVTNDAITRIRTSQFSFVDLAGSERQKVVGTAGERLKEGCLINKSLMVLASVINSLVDISEGKSRFVHYRDSKLTFLLKYSLGGNAKTSVIANISPASTSYIETLSTLKFAQRAKLIKNKVRINEDTSGTLESLKNEIFRLRQELANMRSIINIGGGIKYEDGRRDSASKLGIESDYGSEMLSNRNQYDSVEDVVPEMRPTQKGHELERLLKQSLDILTESEAHLLSELSKKDDIIGKFENAYETFNKNEAQMKLVIKLLSDKVERYKGLLAKRVITNKDLENVRNEQDSELRKRVVQTLREPQGDYQKENIKELAEIRDENLRIKEEYKQVVELLAKKESEFARLSASLAESMSKKGVKDKPSEMKDKEGSKEDYKKIREEYDELVKEYMDMFDKLEEREQEIVQMKQDFENMEQEKMEMTETLTKEVEQIKRDYNKRVERIVKEKETSLDQAKGELIKVVTENEKLRKSLGTMNEEKAGLEKEKKAWGAEKNNMIKHVEELRENIERMKKSLGEVEKERKGWIMERNNLNKQLEELREKETRMNKANQERLTSLSKFEDKRQKEIDGLYSEFVQIQEALRAALEENEELKAKNERFNEERTGVLKEIDKVKKAYETLEAMCVLKDQEARKHQASFLQMEKEHKGKEQEIAGIKKEFEEVARALADRNNMVQAMENEMVRLCEQKARCEQKAERMEKELESQKEKEKGIVDEFVALRQKLEGHKAKDQTIEAVKARFEEVSKALAQKSSEVGALESEIGKIKQEKERNEKKAEELEKECNRLNQACSSQKQQEKAILEELRALQQRLEAKTQECNGIKGEYEGLRHKYEEREKECEGYRRELETLGRKLIEKEKEIGSLRSNWESLKIDSNSQDQEMQGLKGLCEALKKDLHNKTEEIQKTKDYYESVKSSLVEKQQEADQLRASIEKANDRMLNSQQELTKTKSELAALQGSYVAKEKEMIVLQGEIEEIKAQKSNGDRQIEALGKQCKALQERLTKETEEAVRIKEEYEYSKNRNLSKDQEFTEIVQQFHMTQNENLNNQHEIRLLKQEIQELQERYALKEGALERYREDYEEWKSKYMSKEEDFARLKIESENFKKAISELQEENDSLKTRSYVIENEFETLRKEKEMLETEFERVSSLQAELETEVVQLGEEYSKLKSERARLKLENEGYKMVEEKLKEQIKLRLKSVEKLEAQSTEEEGRKSARGSRKAVGGLDSFMEELALRDRRIKKIEGKIVCLKEEIKEKEEVIRQKEEVLERMHEELKEKSRELLEEKEEKGHLREEFNLIMSEKNQIEAYEKELRSEVRQLTEELTKQKRYEDKEGENMMGLLAKKEQEVGKLKRQIEEVVSEREILYEKVESSKILEAKLRKEIHEYSTKISKIYVDQENEIKEIKEQYMSLTQEHRSLAKSVSAKESQIVRLQEDLQIILSEKNKLQDEVKYYKRAKSRNEQYHLTGEDGNLGEEYLGEQREESSEARNTKRRAYEEARRYSEQKKLEDTLTKERSSYNPRGSYTTAKENESLKSEKKNNDHQSLTKAIARSSPNSYLTPQKGRSQALYSKLNEMERNGSGFQSSTSGMEKSRDIYGREREGEVGSEVLKNSILEKEALIIKQKIYLGQPLNDCYESLEDIYRIKSQQQSPLGQKARSLIPTPNRGSPNKYVDYTSGNPQMRTPVSKNHEAMLVDDVYNSHQKMIQMSAKNSPSKFI